MSGKIAFGKAIRIPTEHMDLPLTFVDDAVCLKLDWATAAPEYNVTY